MASSADKGKEKEVSTHGSTLFVSNLPYTATSVDLQTLFSDIAPVRSAFVVTEHGTGVSKGVGYVSFAIKEDAQMAFETIEKDGIDLVGRKLRVQWAENKPKDKDREPKPKPAPRAARPSVPRLPHDPLAIRTVIVTGLPSPLDSKTLWKKIRKCEGAEKVDWPIAAEGDEEDKSTAHVLFTTPAQASDAVSKLHAHVYKGSLLSATLKKRFDVLSKPATGTTSTNGTKVKSTAKSAAPSHASRLIVRNTPFNATEQDLRAVFLPYGPIYSIHIPTDDKHQGLAKNEEGTSKTQTRTKGFAFIWFLSKKDAERAIEGCNGLTVRAGTARALVEDKQKKKKVRRLEAKSRGEKGKGKEKTEEAKDEEDEETEDEEQEEQEQEDDDKAASERVIAVDWALSKDRWKEEKAKMDLDEDGEDVEMADPDASSSSSSEDGGESDGEHEGLGVHGDSDSDGSHSDSDINDEDEQERTKPELPPPETGTTLFVRNVPFEATEDELRTLFRTFGPLRYARITLDPATRRSRGTGFACFWKKEDADRAISVSELVRGEMSGGGPAVPKKNPFTLPSLLTPDPSSLHAQSLVLHGRTLDVVRAVTRDVAGKLKETNERAREKKDKRNLYLLREGVIMPNSPTASLLTPADIDRRTRSFNARRALLRSNPSLYVSRTRLSVRQIPTWVTERMVRRLVVHAVKEFEKEVGEGARAGLADAELEEAEGDGESASAIADAVPETKAEEDEQPKKKRKYKSKPPTKKNSLIIQTKIVRQPTRIDPLLSTASKPKGKSKGYGFVELSSHANALRFLRWANNNPEVGRLFGAWWKEEVGGMLENEVAKGKAKAAGKDGESEGKDEARIKRLKDELARLDAGGVGDDDEDGEGGSKKGKRVAKGTLIVEFSIENVQVVQRRNAMQKEKKEKSTADHSDSPTKFHKRKREDADTEETSPSKKARKGHDKSRDQNPKSRPTSPSKVKAKSEPKSEASESKRSKEKFTNPLGAIIGRKRKERKGGKKGRT